MHAQAMAECGAVGLEAPECPTRATDRHRSSPTDKNDRTERGGPVGESLRVLGWGTSGRASKAVLAALLLVPASGAGCGENVRDDKKATTYELPPQGQLAPLFENGEEPTVVVSLTFDDGFASQGAFFEILEQNAIDGIHGTFYLNSSRLNLEGTERDPRDLEKYAPLDVWIAAARAGHEIGAHTATHRDLSCTQERYEQGLCQTGHKPLDAEDLHREVCGDRELLQALGFDVSGFAYPFGRDTSGHGNDNLDDVVAACGFSYARGTKGLARGSDDDSGLPLAETFPPEAVYGIRSYESLSADIGFEDVKSWILDARKAGGGWVPILMHHISADCTDPENAETVLDVCTRRGELEDLVRWLASDAPEDVETRTVGQIMAELGQIRRHKVANGDLEEPHGGSVERPKCFDRFQGLHEENFEWSSAAQESARVEDGDWGDPVGANGHFEKLIPTESHPTPLVQMTTRDDGCYLAVEEGSNVQVRLRARARNTDHAEVHGRFVIEALRIPIVDGRATPTWSEWLTGSDPSQLLTEEWQLLHLNLPPVPKGVAAITIGYQYLTPAPESGDSSEIWIDDFELLEFP